jgi:hypothetical protein
MEAPQFCVSSGECCHGTEDGHCSFSVLTAEGRAVSFMAGNGIANRDGQTASGVSVGDAAHAPDCGTPPRVAICAQQASGGWGKSVSCFALSETCLARSPGFLTYSPRLKRRRKLASVNCHPSVGTANGERLTSSREELVDLLSRTGFGGLAGRGHVTDYTYE